MGESGARVRPTVLQDVELRGRQLKTGQRVLNFFMSGNRDEAAFEKPEEFNLVCKRNNVRVAFT